MQKYQEKNLLKCKKIIIKKIKFENWPNYSNSPPIYSRNFQTYFSILPNFFADDRFQVQIDESTPFLINSTKVYKKKQGREGADYLHER